MGSEDVYKRQAHDIDNEYDSDNSYEYIGPEDIEYYSGNDSNSDDLDLVTDDSDSDDLDLVTDDSDSEDEGIQEDLNDNE